MRLWNLIPERWQKLAHEAAKFGIVGLLNTGVSWGIAFALLHSLLPHGELKATLVGSAVATVTAYLLNRFWTYRNRPTGSMRREYAMFFLFNAIGMGIDLGMVYLFRDLLDLTGSGWYAAARVIGLVLGTMFRFWAYRTLVFRNAPVVDNEWTVPEPASTR